MGALSLTLNDNGNNFLDGTGFVSTSSPPVYYVFLLSGPVAIYLSFQDSFALSDQFLDQPLIVFSDGIYFNDGFNLQLGSLLLLFDSDFFIIEELLLQETITSISFNDLMLFNDSFFLGQQNAPSLSDAYIFNDNLGVFCGCYISLSDNIANFNDSLIFNEGFVSVNIVINDFIHLRDAFIFVLPNVTILLIFGDTVNNYLDSLSTSNVEMLNTYLRRYLNDVIQN